MKAKTIKRVSRTQTKDLKLTTKVKGSGKRYTRKVKYKKPLDDV